MVEHKQMCAFKCNYCQHQEDSRRLKCSDSNPPGLSLTWWVQQGTAGCRSLREIYQKLQPLLSSPWITVWTQWLTPVCGWNMGIFLFSKTSSNKIFFCVNLFHGNSISIWHVYYQNFKKYTKDSQHPQNLIPEFSSHDSNKKYLEIRAYMTHEDTKLSRSRAILLFSEHSFCAYILTNTELYCLYAFVPLN